MEAKQEQKVKKQKAKETEDNALHTEYGILSNCAYMLKKTAQYRPRLLTLCALGVIVGACSEVMASFVGKYVIDMAQRQAAAHDFVPLLKLMLVVFVVMLVVFMLENGIGNIRWTMFICVRMEMISERVEKALTMNYERLEQPAMLDMHRKAAEATGGNENGVEGLLRNMYTMMRQAALLAVTLSAVMVLDFRLILILFVIAFFQYLFFRYTVKKDKREVWDKLSPVWRKIDYMEHTTQDFGSAKDIRLFGIAGWLSAKQHGAVMEKQEKILHSRDLWIRNTFFAHGGNILSSMAVYAMLIWAFLGGGMTIGNFTLYLGLATTFTNALSRVFNICGDIKKCSLQVDDFRSFLALGDDDESGCIPVPETDSYTFTFRNVSFRYAGAEDYALKNLNLTLKAGERLAVVGLNGAGKTTFIKLLLRLYDVTEGEILLNGINIKRFRRADYYRVFSPVFQNVELYAFPMSENVSMKPPEETDAARAEECLMRAGMEEKLSGLPDGVYTQMLKVLYDDGIDLSGGERQKLALARALYKDAPVIVLDEPTAALDALAEYRLYKSFDDIIGGRTAVYISHRLSSTRFCDNIVMFEAGELVEYGNHEELLARGGPYAKMFAVQAQYYQEGREDCYAG